MKKPETSADVSDPDLIGSKEDRTWVIGKNCVYRDSSVANYRVSIHTSAGWKSYGHFHDSETATCVANIAILVEGCEEKYELNKNIGPKSRQELAHWRNQANNTHLERIAREKYSEVLAAIEILDAEEARLRTAAEQQYKDHENEKRDRIQKLQEQRAEGEAEQLLRIPTAALLEALQHDISGSQSRAIRAALDKRGFGRRAT